MDLNRRQFVAASTSAALAGTCSIAGSSTSAATASPLFPQDDKKLPFKISIAQWSLHRMLNNQKLITNLDFPRVAKQAFGIDAIEYVNQFFRGDVSDKYLARLKKNCADHGVKSLLIMVDGEGRLGDPDNGKRKNAVDNHQKWLEAAKHLDCHSIRVNAASAGSYEEQTKLAADGLSQLSEAGEKFGLNVIVENHGGLSSNGAWLAQVIKSVGKKNCGTLPDFGNFRVKDDDWYDRYKGVTELMPFAKAVSAKSHQFDENGNETKTDFVKMMKIVLDAGYKGYVGIEFEGKHPDGEFGGVVATRKLLEKCQKELADYKPRQ